MVNMFGNIAFLNEGEQAEEYKRKKAEEAAAKEKEKEEAYNRRYKNNDDVEKVTDDGVEHSYRTNSVGSQNKRIKGDATFKLHTNSKEDSKRGFGAELASSKLNEKRTGRPGYDPEEADAINRNIRRHPDKWKYDKDGRAIRKESSIFESVEFI